MSVERWIGDASVCVCAGPGGVGKTTVAAALAVGLARRGRNVVVLTIDPARRLADALGIEELGNEPREIPLDHDGPGALWALMLDPKRTFDEVVGRYAPDEAARDAVLSNRIYRELSGAVAGSQEYMAMEKVYELHESGRFDVLVVDTPPARHALDFLDAPERLTRLLDSSALQMLMTPSRMGLRLMGRGSSVLFGGLRKLTGVDALEDLTEFFRSIDPMMEGLRGRAARVRELLGGAEAAFIVVSSPRAESVADALDFAETVEDRGLRLVGAVANRVHRTPAARTADLALLGPRLAEKVTAALADQRALGTADAAALEELRTGLGKLPLAVVPDAGEGVHDMAALTQLDQHLFGP